MAHADPIYFAWYYLAQSSAKEQAYLQWSDSKNFKGRSSTAGDERRDQGCHTCGRVMADFTGRFPRTLDSYPHMSEMVY